VDIDDVALNQSVSVTLDAYPGETFEASVTHISRIGESDASITTYPVEVTLQYDERLLEGMNGSAVILTATRDNVVLLPISMLKEDANGEYVFVQAAEGKSYPRLESPGSSTERTPKSRAVSQLAICLVPVETANPYAPCPHGRIDNAASSSQRW
jgi:HlyD family secretion protein